jgi:TIR domain
MSQKIFISYRRDDSAASAIGISQYLEHEFGGKNVFIDVDMRAGAKFPQVLEARLAECKVMLVLIGPGWIDARDEQGHRRLDNPDDWVRLEIAHALKRNITVIPVQINRAALPARTALPEDIRGLLDRQSTSVTNASFRHDMAGLVRDIRAIPSPRTWRRPVAIAAGVAVLIGIGFMIASGVVPDAVERIRLSYFPPTTESTNQNGIWSSRPGEWILFATNNQTPVSAYYLQPASVRRSGDAVVYTARFPLLGGSPTPADATQPTYEDNVSVIDCKKSTFALAERVVYSKSGAVLSRFNFGDPQTLTTAPIAPGAIASGARRLLCDNLSAPVLTKAAFTNSKLSYLSRTAKGDANIYYGPLEPVSDLPFQFELVTLLRFDADRPFTELFSTNVIGLPPRYRSLAQRLKAYCIERKLSSPKIDYFDSDGNWLFVSAPNFEETINPAPGSAFAQLLALACGAGLLSVAGTYEGISHTSYGNRVQGEQKIALIVDQTGDEVSVTFRTPLGEYGKGTGKLNGTRIDSLSLQSALSPTCAGAYETSVEFAGDTAKWSFKGKDCNGEMEGHGTATRTRS